MLPERPLPQPRRASPAHSNPPLRLITMPHSHFCEKARWALDHAGIPYAEEPHLPLFHAFHTRRHRGDTVPILVTPGCSYTTSSDIVRFADRTAPDAALLPCDPEQRLEALAWESYFDRELGPATRLWAYFHLSRVQSTLNRIASAGVPASEALLTPLVMALATPLIRRAYTVDADRAGSALRQIRRVFDQVSGCLERQTTPSLGKSFGVADITFAALASPVLLPRQYGGSIPGDADVPGDMLTELRRFRELPAGAYALRIYERHRSRRSD